MVKVSTSKISEICFSTSRWLPCWSHPIHSSRPVKLFFLLKTRENILIFLLFTRNIWNSKPFTSSRVSMNKNVAIKNCVWTMSEMMKHKMLRHFAHNFIHFIYVWQSIDFILSFSFLWVLKFCADDDFRQFGIPYIVQRFRHHKLFRLIIFLMETNQEWVAVGGCRWDWEMWMKISSSSPKTTKIHGWENLLDFWWSFVNYLKSIAFPSLSLDFEFAPSSANALHNL